MSTASREKPAAKHGVIVYEISPQHASVEEAFIRLTADSVEYRAKEGR